MIIGACLAIMLVLTLLSVLFGNSFVGAIVETSISGTNVLNGSSSTFSLDNIETDFRIDSLEGAIVIIVVIILFATLIGVKILSSGLSESAHRIVVICTCYFGIWIILSVLGGAFIFQIQEFGALIYISITIIYVIGVIQKGISNEDT